MKTKRMLFSLATLLLVFGSVACAQRPSPRAGFDTVIFSKALQPTTTQQELNFHED